MNDVKTDRIAPFCTFCTGLHRIAPVAGGVRKGNGDGVPGCWSYGVMGRRVLGCREWLDREARPQTPAHPSSPLPHFLYLFVTFSLPHPSSRFVVPCQVLSCFVLFCPDLSRFVRGFQRARPPTSTAGPRTTRHQVCPDATTEAGMFRLNLDSALGIAAKSHKRRKMKLINAAATMNRHSPNR